MMKRILFLIPIVLILFACIPTPTVQGQLPTFTPAPPTATITLTPTSTSTNTPTATPRPMPARVLIVSFDGLRPEAITEAPMPNLIALIERGAYTLNAQTIYPSYTLPSHTSMLTGFCPADHGVDWNDYEPDRGYAQVDSIFSTAHDQGLKTIFVVGKQKLSQITRPETISQYLYSNDPDPDVATEATALLAGGFDLAFIHFAAIDGAGHESGWMSSEQLDVARHADEALNILLAALETSGLRDSTLIILTADHGGHNTTHGSDSPEDMIIPWVMVGPGVDPQELLNPVNTTDTAATAAWILKLPFGGKAVGQPIFEAFGFPAAPRPVERCP